MNTFRIMYDTKSNKSGVEIYRCEQSLNEKRGVVCFFHITNSENDYQSTDSYMVECGHIPVIDKFVQGRIKELIERDKKDIECVEYLKSFLVGC